MSVAGISVAGVSVLPATCRHVGGGWLACVPELCWPANYVCQFVITVVHQIFVVYQPMIIDYCNTHIHNSKP